MNLACKSFFNIGYSLNKCYNCSYCVLKNTNYKQLELPYNKNIPVAVNMFYGDPLLQLDRTYEILDRLEESQHKGVVFLLTKGDYSKFSKREYDLDLHIAFSTFGITHELDGGSVTQFVDNLKESLYDNYTHSIEYRPVITGINDTQSWIFDIAEQYNYPIAYGGLIENQKRVSEKFEDMVKLSKVKCYRKTLKLLEDR